MKDTETLAIRKYILYIQRRLKFIKSEILDVSDNEWSYYEELYSYLNAYYKTHLIYFKYILGKINLKEAQCFLGLSERSTLRYFKKQRETLILFIEQKELLLFAKFPFSEKNRQISKFA